MKERPIIFSGPMVRAILDGRKTQTRRIVKPQPHVTLDTDAAWRDASADLWRNARQYARDCSPFGNPGDVLWVREANRTGAKLDKFSYSEIENLCRAAGFKTGPCAPLKYEADGMVTVWGSNDREEFGGWGRYRHARFMPSWASRIRLLVKSVRVERLQDISQEDARAEGAEGGCVWCGVPNGTCDCERPRPDYRDGFVNVWHAIHGPNSWPSNPWVWVYEFGLQK